MEKVDPVKLIVKASNQQFDDQIVECLTTWSILKLKQHLADVYPCKPTIPEQKLIYHGQLLKDQGILKDILRTYDDVEPSNHIFHLVYTPNLRQQPLRNDIKQSSDGLRQRTNINNNQRINDNGIISSDTVTTNNGSSSNAASSIPSINIPQMMNNSTGITTNCPTSSSVGAGSYAIGFGNGGLLAQQMAMQNWQQVYAQYMNQYMNLLSVGVRPETFFMQNQLPTQGTGNVGAMGFSGILPQMPFNQPNIQIRGSTVPQTNIFEQQNLLPNSNEPLQQQQQQQQPQIPGDHVDGGGATAEVNAGQPIGVQQQPQPAAPAPGRFPQIVQEEQDNRDWLDTFYSFSRLMVLLTLVYFYSSPLRCLSVLFIAIAIYMYHIGYFRSGPRETNNNNNNNNNNINRPVIDVAGGGGGGGVNEQQQAAADVNQPANNDDNLVAASAGTVAPAAVNAGGDPNIIGQNDESNNATPDTATQNFIQITSVIAFVRTFVVTFFTSLLPETATL